MDKTTQAIKRVKSDLSPVKWVTSRQWPLTPLKERFVALADSQVGVNEVPLGSNKGVDVEAYLASVSLPGGHAWCAAFVHWCLLHVYRRSFYPGGERVLAGVRNWPTVATSRGALVKSPSRGTIGGWVHGNGTGHIFICISSPVMGVFRTIEGNTDDSGSRQGVGVRKRIRTMASMKRFYKHFFIDVDRLYK